MSIQPAEDLPTALAELHTAAVAVRERAYAPYSHYRVGAAVRTASGAVFAGANVENVTYGLAVCAERNAILAAVLAGESELEAILVVTENAGAPCGLCRQTAREFARDCEVHLGDPQGVVRSTTLSALLPEAFGPEDLPRP